MTLGSRFVSVFLVSAYPSEPHAHTSFGGPADSITSQLINGALHPLVVPQHLLLLVVVGFLVGQQDSRTINQCAVVGGLALAIGLIFSTDFGSRFFVTAATVLTVAAGLLVASDSRSGRALIIAIVALGGLLIGLDSPVSPTASAPQMVAIHAGTWIGASAALFYAGFATHDARAQWLKVGLRILASWFTAASVMLLALKVAAPS